MFSLYRYLQTTTPTPAPKTTPAPTPAPVIGKPDEAKYVVTEGNTSCILVQFATQLNVSYTGNDRKKIFCSHLQIIFRNI